MTTESTGPYLLVLLFTSIVLIVGLIALAEGAPLPGVVLAADVFGLGAPVLGALLGTLVRCSAPRRPVRHRRAAHDRPGQHDRRAGRTPRPRWSRG